MENKLESSILKLFLFNNNLKFSEIEKLIKIRSNKLAYHIKNLVKKGVLIKNQESYSLSETAEYIIPYLSDKNAALPVILVYIGNKTHCFLYKKQKRPFKDYISLPGGRLLVNESIEEATKRIMSGFGINAVFKKINSISLEHVKKRKSNDKIYSFLLIFVSASTKSKLALTDIDKNKRKIIKSDYQLIKSDLNKEIKIKTVFSIA